MRIEYEVFQRLVWDAEFRRQFIGDRPGTLARYYPQALPAIFADLSVAGLEEEVYRRMAGLHRTAKELFPLGHNVLVAFLGEAFFEHVLRGIFRSWLPSGVAGGNPEEILEPFDGYVIGPRLLRTVTDWAGQTEGWLAKVIQYEWAKWHARRVASGWPPVEITPPLADGATLVAADFDLRALLTEVTRLQAASVGPALYQTRIQPSPGAYRAVIFPSGTQVMEANLNPEAFARLSQIVSEPSQGLETGIADTLTKIGLLSTSSFLCCSREATYQEQADDALANAIEPGMP